jgi:hypothetical protein
MSRNIIKEVPRKAAEYMSGFFTIYSNISRFPRSFFLRNIILLIRVIIKKETIVKSDIYFIRKAGR